MAVPSKYAGIIPEGALKVKIKDADGDILYRSPEDIKDTDEVVINPKTGVAFAMMSAPGRPPKKGRPNPTPGSQNPTQKNFSSAPAADEVAKRKYHATKRDPMLSKIRESGESFDVIQFILEQLAEESVALRVERESADLHGKDSSQISLRRAQILKTLGDTFFKRRAATGEKELDLEGRTFGIVWKLLCETFVASMEKSNIPGPMADVVMNNFAKEVDSDAWKDECKRRMKSRV